MAESARGQAMPAGVQRHMESRFGVGFNDVRIHTDAGANKLNRDIQAQAFTQDNHIYFSQGKFEPGAISGKHLLAHELTHVLQQTGTAQRAINHVGGGDSAKVQRKHHHHHSNSDNKQSEPVTKPAPDAPAQTGVGQQNTPQIAPPGQVSPTTVSAPTPTPSRDDETVAKVNAKCREIRDLWYSTRSNEAVYHALMRISPGERITLDMRFQGLFGFSLFQEIKTGTRDEYGIRALGVMKHGSDNVEHVTLALILHANAGKLSELLGILKRKQSVSTRQNIRDLYNQIYTYSTNGGLEADIRMQLQGPMTDWEAEQAIALLERNLTDADDLYAETAGIPGTHGGKTLDILRRVMAKGYDAFRKLDMDWANNIKGKGWSNEYLYTMLKSELKGVIFRGETFNEEWNIARAYLDSYEGAKKQENSAGKISESAEIDMQIKAAEGVLAAASGVGTNDQAVIQASQLLQQAWARRIASARKNNPDRVAELEQEWARVRARLLNEHKATGGKSIRLDDRNLSQLRAAVGGANSTADQIYGAGKAGQYDQVLSLVTSAWATGQLGQYFNDAGKAVKEMDGAVIRPAFRADDIVPIDAGDARFMRIYALLDPRIDDDFARGANRIKTEFAIKGNSVDGVSPADGDLAELLGFLRTPGMRADLREGAVTRYMSQYQGYIAGGLKKPSEAFMEMLKKFDKGEGNNYLEILRLLAPTNKQDTKEKLKRAKGRMAATSTGAASGVLKWAVKTKASVTGSGDTNAFAEHQLNKMEFAADDNNAKTNPAHQILQNQNEVSNTEDLVDKTEQGFDAALASYRTDQKEVADLIAGAVELAVEIAFTVVTGGSGSAAIYSAIAQLAAKQATKELLLGADNKLISSENVQEIISAVLSTYINEFGDVRKRIADRVDFESTQWMTRKIAAGQETSAKMVGNALQNLGAGIAEQTITSLATITTDSILRQKYPTAETLAGEAYRIAFTSAGRSLHAFGGTYKYNPGVLANDLLSFQDRLKTNFYFKELVKAFEGTGGKLAELAAMDTQNMTWTEIMAKIGLPQLKGMGLTSPMKSLASAYGQMRQVKSRKAQVEIVKKADPNAEKMAVQVLMQSPEIQQSYYWHRTNKAAGKETPISTLQEYVEKKKINDINRTILDNFEIMMKAQQYLDKSQLADRVPAAQEPRADEKTEGAQPQPA